MCWQMENESQLSRWMWKSGDWERRESPRASGGQVINGRERKGKFHGNAGAWGSDSVAESKDRGRVGKIKTT